MRHYDGKIIQSTFVSASVCESSDGRDVMLKRRDKQRRTVLDNSLFTSFTRDLQFNGRKKPGHGATAGRGGEKGEGCEEIGAFVSRNYGIDASPR